MATITGTNIASAGAVTITETTMDGTDDFVYDANKSPVLILRNGSGGALTVTIDGSDATTVSCGGTPPIDISAGYSTGSIADGATVVITLSTISRLFSWHYRCNRRNRYFCIIT